MNMGTERLNTKMTNNFKAPRMSTNLDYLELVKTIKRAGFESILGLSNNFLE